MLVGRFESSAARRRKKMLITFHHPRKVETELNSTAFILRNLPNISETLRKLFDKNFIQLFHLSLDCCMFSSLHWKKLMKSSENSISLPRNAHHSPCRGCLQNFFHRLEIEFYGYTAWDGVDGRDEVLKLETSFAAGMSSMSKHRAMPPRPTQIKICSVKIWKREIFPLIFSRCRAWAQ